MVLVTGGGARLAYRTALTSVYSVVLRRSPSGW